ncbi:G-protein coupled receptor 183 [Pungitius pungitius]|uniref:G-protein coupled receptor 183 n=1 Tax=Pungitius pungitius TaxID=134920 RepID=UPI002E100975
MSGKMAFENSTPDPANHSSCNVFVYQRSAVVLFPIFYSVVFIISACGNSLVLYVICQRKQKFNSTSVYLVNLALSDSLFTLALPARIVYYIRHFDWPFGDLLCRLTTLLFYANTYAGNAGGFCLLTFRLSTLDVVCLETSMFLHLLQSQLRHCSTFMISGYYLWNCVFGLAVTSLLSLPGIGFMTCISLDRYLAVVHPHRLQCLRSARVVRGVSYVVWALVSLEVAPLLFHSMLREDQGRRTCMEYLNLEGSRLTPYLLLLACAASFCCPLAVIGGCYAKINLKLRAAAEPGSLTAASRRNRRVNAIILLILLTFTVCFGPYHLNVMQFMSRKIHHQVTCEELRAFKVSLQITVSLMNFNCCLDPVIYFFAIKTYKKRVLRLLKDCLYTSAASSKITADNSSSNT